MFPSTQSLSTQSLIPRVLAFTPPSAPPPGDNVAPPLNTGSDDQGKLGDLGIGAASPATGIALDVTGIIESTGAITSGGQVTGTEFSIGSYYLRPNNAATSLYTLGSITALGTTNANYFAGKVGIGTTAPSQKLDVVGNINVSGKLTIDGDIDVGDTYGANMLSNTFDWTDSDLNGYADGWSYVGSYTCVGSIVTGNGFTGNAQRSLETNAINYETLIQGGVTFNVGSTYRIRGKYRSSAGFYINKASGPPYGQFSANTGNAISFETIFVATETGWYLASIGTDAWLELDEVELQILIPGSTAVPIFSVDTDKLYVSYAGKVGIGTTSPTAAFHVATNGALSQPGIKGDGTWVTGGTQTTTKPYFLLEPAGTSSTTWLTSGTGLGINAASGFNGNLIDARVAGVAKFSVAGTGNITGAGLLTSDSIQFTTGLTSTNSQAGIANLWVAGGSGGAAFSNGVIPYLTVEGTSGTAYRAYMIGFSNYTIPTAGYNYGTFILGQGKVIEASSGNHPLIASMIMRPVVITGDAATVSNTATLYIEDAPSATVSGGNYALWVKAGTSAFGGNVGIGTTSPNATLEVKGIGNTINTNSLRIINSDSRTLMKVMDNGYIYIGERSTGSNTWTHKFTGDSLLIGNTAGDYGFSIISNSNMIQSIGGTARNFYLADSGGTRITIEPVNGNVGIGTTNPTAKFQVSNQGLSESTFYTGGAVTGIKLQSQTTNARTMLGIVPNGTNDLADMWLFSTSDTVTNFSALAVGYEEGSGFWAWNSMKGGSATTHPIYFNATNGQTAATANLVLATSGNVGIGTTSPNNLLQVTDLISFIDADKNTKIGYQAGKNVVSGATYNTFLGYRAGLSSATLSTTAATENTAIGAEALMANTVGNHNTAVGVQSLYANTQGNYNTALGEFALYRNTAGYYNTAIGYNALSAVLTGVGNFAIGTYALAAATGNSNIGIGTYAGAYQEDGVTPLTSIQNSIYLGSYSRGKNNSDSNSIVIGYGAIGIGANTIVLGNDSILTTALKGNVGIGTTNPAATALLDLTSTEKGFLAPRMTTVQRDAILSPATGLFIYNTITNQYNVYNGTSWGAVGGGGGGIGTYVGATSFTYSGNNNNNNGYAYAHARCAAAYTGSHVCAAYEILNTIASGGALPAQDVWIFIGPPGYTALANDCDARTRGTSAAYGAYWQKPGTGYPEGRGLLMRCDYVLRLACCM